MPETKLDMARRHVREGAGRIDRQKRLVAELERNGHRRILPDARGLLAAMQEFQIVAGSHLAELEGQP